MTEDNLIGKQLGEYKLETLLGQGGMARVYLAVDVRLKRRAVVKVIDPPFRNDPDYVMRFEREAQAIAQLDHPNIVKIFRFDEQDGLLYMAMQYVEGADLSVTLANIRAEQKYIDPEEASRIIREICLALDYAHSKGVIHRDIKPANILMDQNRHAIVSDFGLALLTEIGTSGEVLGSAHYLAPEQAVSSAKVVPQSDLYSVGVILYEMFTGDVPFKAENPLDIVIQHMSEALLPPSSLRSDLSPAVEAVIVKSLAKEPGDRYPSGAELSEALEQSLKTAASPIASIPIPPPETLPDEKKEAPALRPLPLMPAAVSAPPSEGLPTPSKEVIAPASRKPWLYIGAGVGLIVLLLLFFCLALVMIPPMMNRLALPVSSQTLPAETTGTIQPKQPAQTATSISIPVKNKPTRPAPSATPTPESYMLSIIKGPDSLIVINLSENDFSLAQLRFENGKRTLSGSAWGVSKLQKGECVAALKSEGPMPPIPPEAKNCQMVGQIRIKKKDLPSDGKLIVYYNGKQVGICDKPQPSCAIQISAEPAQP